MKAAKLMAEMKVGLEKIRNKDAMEINLRLSHPPEERRYRQPSRPGPPYPGYPPPMTARKEYPRENYDVRRGVDLHKGANVRVNSVSVNVRTTPA